MADKLVENAPFCLRAVECFCSFIVFVAVPASSPGYGISWSPFSFMIANAVFVWIISLWHLGLGQMVVEKLGVPSLAQLREQYGSIIALGLDLNFALWSFCAFASSASNLNATHPSPIPMSKETFTLYNYCTTLSPVNQTPVGCGGTPGRVAAGVAFSFFLWLAFMASSFFSYKNRTSGSNQGHSQLSEGLSQSEMSMGLGQVPSTGGGGGLSSAYQAGSALSEPNPQYTDL